MNAAVVTRFCALLYGTAAALAAFAAEPKALPANTWTNLAQAAVLRHDAPLIWEPDAKRFMLLGGSIGGSVYAKGHPFDELALDLGRGEWENRLPAGKEWGPAFGNCKPPAWKTEYWTTQDAEGNCRPNLNVSEGGYGVLYSGQYAFDPDSRRAFFYIRGSTLVYDTAARTWKDLAPLNHPEKALGGKLLWSSMCYLGHLRKVLLFGGGNIHTERGDPGTWLYDPVANTWEQLPVARQPPQRANAPMAYDPVARKAVIFGGDQLNQLINDTWTFDGRTWEEKKPAIAPAPRAGHALLWLAKAKKVLLLGGYGYDSGWGYYPAMYRNRPMEAWTYDAAADRWDLLAAWEKDAPDTCLTPLRGGMIGAATDADGTVLVLSRSEAYGGPLKAWLCRIDAAQSDAAGAARLGAVPGAVERRKQFYDPQWYPTKAGPGDPQKVRAELEALAPNTWTMRPQPNRPEIDVCWGTAVYSPEHDAIMRFSGGHCVYSGTAPQVYDVKTDRWSIPFAPEMHLDFCAGNNGPPDGWSFSGSPWMPGHSYNATGYEPASRTMLYVSTGHTFFFDPATGRWSHAAAPNPLYAHPFVSTLVNTPRGVVLWAGQAYRETALFALDAGARTWSRLPVKGPFPMVGSGDHHGMAYDSRRDRLLLFSAADKNKGDVMACDLKTGEAAWLDAAGKARAGVGSRNALYLPELDAVLIGNHVQTPDGKKLWPLYDCAKNAWFGLAFAGDDPMAKTAFYSLAVMRDARRGVLWTVDHVNRVHALKLEPNTLTRHPLE
jgi:hypothetical protein